MPLVACLSSVGVIVIVIHTVFIHYTYMSYPSYTYSYRRKYYVVASIIMALVAHDLRFAYDACCMVHRSSRQVRVISSLISISSARRSPRRSNKLLIITFSY